MNYLKGLQRRIKETLPLKSGMPDSKWYPLNLCLIIDSGEIRVILVNNCKNTIQRNYSVHCPTQFKKIGLKILIFFKNSLHKNWYQHMIYKRFWNRSLDPSKFYKVPLWILLISLNDVQSPFDYSLIFNLFFQYSAVTFMINYSVVTFLKI